tara:strand:+ start:381 stop:623 length:243 start_codon:yes stop_codon:yes gene_type:complete
MPVQPANTEAVVGTGVQDSPAVKGLDAPNKNTFETLSSPVYDSPLSNTKKLSKPSFAAEPVVPSDENPNLKGLFEPVARF